MSDDADERERAEAEALARALDASARAEAGGSAAGTSSEESTRDALEAAALLRYGGGEGTLRQDRADAVLARLMPRVDALTPTRAHTGRRRALRWIPIGASALAVAAGAWLVLSTAWKAAAPSDAEQAASSAGVPEPELEAPPVSSAAGAAPGSNALPAPPQRLLAAQAALVDEKASRDRAAFDAEMHAYREQVLRALERAYPARLGMLAPRGPR